MPNIGVPGLIIILVIALIVFGPKKLPQLGRAVGETLREFKTSTKSVVDEVTDEFKIEETSDSKKEKQRMYRKRIRKETGNESVSKRRT
ncbi:Sec-independent protein translocase protein TatB [Ureibacillus acetophenoni]|uniref:Sec-independent protein translocase protein TatA n=1 Tax=Ureibacillus acetophenoni TaxID=614649 RepID=A0A285URG2_9BACL|nr:Sec-independent protein translocase protein TatB [Ureibacillus acetophenoni]SOC44450.1 sec-independent protein translocase protein TatA [Ureibacillus acetophenoni]